MVCHSSRLPCGNESFSTVLSIAGKIYVLQWLQDRLMKSLNHLGCHCCLGFFQRPTEYSGFCRPGKSVLAQEMCIIANIVKNYKRGKSHRCEVFFLAQAQLNYNVKNRRGETCLCLITWQKIEMSGRRYNKEACLRAMNTSKAQYYILLNLPNHWIYSRGPWLVSQHNHFCVYEKGWP